MRMRRMRARRRRELLTARVEKALRGRVEAGGDHGHLHFVLHLRIDDRAEDDVRFFVGRLLNDRSRFMNFEQRHVRAAGDVDQDALRSFDGSFLQER